MKHLLALLIFISSSAFGANGYVDIGGSGGAANWKDSVLTTSALPAIGNSPGDARISLDTFDIYVWNGTTWVTSGGGGFVVTNVTASAPLASTGGSAPNISITQASGGSDGYLSSIDWNLFNRVTGVANAMSGYDSSGLLYSIPGWFIDPTFFGLDGFQSIDPPNTNTYTVHNRLSMNLTPTGASPNNSNIGIQSAIDVDPTDTGFSVGLNAIAARVLDLSVSTRSSSAHGDVNGINLGLDMGDDSIPGGSIKNYTAIEAFMGAHTGYTINNGVRGMNIDGNFQVGSTITGGYQGQTINNQILGSFDGYYSGFTAGGQFSPTNAYTGGMSQFSATTGIAGSLGNVTTFADFSNIQSGSNITGDYVSFAMTPAFHAGAVVRSFTGMNISPNFVDPITDDITGLRINIPNATAGTNINGLVVQVATSTDSNPQGVTGISSDGKIQVNATTTLASGQGFQIGNRIESLFHIPSGSPVTGTDSLGDNFAGDLLAEDNLAAGAGNIGWNSVGFIASVGVAAGKTIDKASVFLPAMALPDPGFTTGGTITDLALVRTYAPVPQGGSVSVGSLYAFQLNPQFGNLSSVATNSWGVWIGDTDADNWFAKDVVIGGSTGKPEVGQALDVTGAVRLRALSTAGNVTTDANGHLSSVATPQVGSSFFPLATGSLTSIVANEIIGAGKAPRAMTIENIEASAAGFTCVSNPTLTLLDCGTSAGACTSGTTTIGSVTLTAANTITDGTVSNPSLAAGHYWAWQVTSGTCTALNATGTAEAKVQ